MVLWVSEVSPAGVSKFILESASETDYGADYGALVD